jgi:Zn-dependent protease
MPGSSGGRVGQLTPETIAMGITSFVVLLFSVSVHEASHAWAALRMGDDTALREGRVSLNPVVHIDPIGTVLMPVVMFLTGAPLLAWAKPTPYNPANFRREVSVGTGHLVVAAAGPLSNMVLALGFTFALFGAARLGLLGEGSMAVANLLIVGLQMNVMLALFNLIPVPPLDGSKVASWGLPRSLAVRYDAMVESVGPFLALALMVVAGRMLAPLNHAVTLFLIELVGRSALS